MKTYLRYELEHSFGVICSTQGSAIFDKTGTLALAPALENVGVWNVRQGSQVSQLVPGGHDNVRGHITHLELSPDGKHAAAGYSSGSLVVFLLSSGDAALTLHGHRAAVLAASRFNADGTLLATGGADTEIVVWDAVAESGMCRLKGHKDGVTDLAFVTCPGVLPTGLASSSKDTLVKIWDLTTQSCVQTIVGHRGEVWSLDVNPTGNRLVTGASDNQIRMWRLGSEDTDEAETDQVGVAHPQEAHCLSLVSDALTHQAPATGVEVMVAVYMGAVQRQVPERAASIRFHTSGPVLGVQGTGKALELWRVRGRDEVAKKKSRRLKRHREKKSASASASASACCDAGTEDAAGAWSEAEWAGQEETCAGEFLTLFAHELCDEIEAMEVLRSHHKIRGFAFSGEMTVKRGVRLLLSLQNNSLELWNVQCHAKRKKGEPSESREAERVAVLDNQGHRSGVRALAISSDCLMCASVSDGLAKASKVWSLRTHQCVRSTACGFGLCVAFAPGDKHLLIGTKQGNLQVIDLGSGDMLRDYLAHEGAVWSLDIRRDGRGLATGSADKSVKLWDFDLVGGNLGAVHARTLKMADDVLCVRYSRHKEDGKLLLAVALLDSTVKVFYEDSLKFFLSLYGHKLPVLSMDISTDGTMIVTGSADKTIKIWGLDFGDCHRSILAHNDSVMALRFVPGTHYVFSCSKDKSIRYWDVDHFERILHLEGHQAEVWGLAVAPTGAFIVSGGHDRGLRVWTRTEEMVFLEEEKEKELESLFEGEFEKGGEPEEGDAIAAAGAKRTIASVSFGERLMDALDLVAQEVTYVPDFMVFVCSILFWGGATSQEADKSQRPPNPFLLQLTPLRYLLRTIQQIKPPDLERALLVLSMAHVEGLAGYLTRGIEAGLEVELCARCAVFLLRVHQDQVVATRSLVEVLQMMRHQLRSQLEGCRDAIGGNMAGLKLLARSIDQDRHKFSLESEVPSWLPPFLSIQASLVLTLILNPSPTNHF
ncbi:unnamed protein product [Chrysoparadoxa australica]